jgi:RNA polymerase sigma-54 factor
MGLSQKLVLKQGQSLVMTPQLQQAIKLLQMSSMELQAFVDAELERNPLLEREEGSAEPLNEPSEKQSPDSLDEAFTGSVAVSEVMGSDAEAPEGASARMADEAAMPRDSGWASLRSSGHLSFDGEDGDFAANLSSGISLAEHLTSQLNLEFTAPADLMIGQHLIGMLNDAGYLSGDPSTLCETIKATPEQVEAVLERMRRFEPAGVFARDLAECLRLQLIDLDHLDPAMAALVDNLPLVARRDFNALKAKCGVTMEDLQDMLAELRALNPKPGLAFGTEPTLPVVPDVFVRPSPDGNWIVELNSETLPRVLVNNRYMATVARGTKQRG